MRYTLVSEECLRVGAGRHMSGRMGRSVSRCLCAAFMPAICPAQALKAGSRPIAARHPCGNSIENTVAHLVRVVPANTTVSHVQARLAC